jgi:HPt (histidine-containing phosphotransfer) domain-containing protein
MVDEAIMSEGGASNSAETMPEIVERLADLGMLSDREFLVESLADFASGVAEHLAAIRKAVPGMDVVRIERGAHGLAGSAMTMGARHLGQLALRLEQDASGFRSEQLDAAVVTLDREAQRVLAFVATMLEERRSDAT